MCLPGTDRLAPVLLAAILLVTAIPEVSAQEVSERRVRSAIEDATRGLGQAVAGGSPLTAPSVPTGGFGGMELGASVTGTFLEIDDPTRPVGVLDFTLPTTTLGAAFGIVGGRSGGLDLIARAGPVVSREGVRDNEVLLALGGRLGLVPEAGLVPAVSVSLVRSWVDDLGWNDPQGDEVSFTGDVVAWSARVDASKRLFLVTPYAGVGLDRTEIEASYRIPPSRSTGDQEIAGGIDTSSTHAKAYAGARIELGLLAVAAETGVYDGGSFLAVGVTIVR